MDAGSALDRLREDLGRDLRVFVDVREDVIDVKYVRVDIDNALEGTTGRGAHESHLRDIANALLTPGGTAAVRYTPEAIVVGMPHPTNDATGYLLSLDHTASEDVDEFIDTILSQGATIKQATVSGPATFSTDGNGNSLQLND